MSDRYVVEVGADEAGPLWRVVDVVNDAVVGLYEEEADAEIAKREAEGGEDE